MVLQGGATDVPGDVSWVLDAPLAVFATDELHLSRHSSASHMYCPTQEYQLADDDDDEE